MLTGNSIRVRGGSCARVERLEHRWLMADAGQLDMTFSGDGRAPFPFGAGVLVGLQPDGKIVHTRAEEGGFRLARLNADGSNDTNFLGGQTLTQHGGTGRYFDVHKTNGRIAVVAADTSPTNDTRVAVFDADGSPRESFDDDGLVDLDLNYVAYRVAWQGDKLILLGGPAASSSSGARFASLELRRLNADGSLDTSFGTAGKVTVSTTQVTEAELAIGPDGQINVALDRDVFDAVAGENDTSLTVHRYTANGQGDASFGGGAGAITVDSGTNDYNMALRAFHVGDDGSIYHLAMSSDGVQFRRFAPDGAIAATSGRLEAAVPNWQSGSVPTQIGLQPDGKVLVFGTAPWTPETNDLGWTIVRLYADGQIDTTYGAGGIATPRFGFNGRALVQGDGKVLVSGDRFGPDGYEAGRIDSGELGVGVIRLNRKGTLLVYGTNAGELISVGVRGRDGKFIARVGNLALGYAPSKIKRIAIFAGAGNDTVNIGNGVRGTYAQGDDGSDILNGGAGDDVLVGGLQPDQLFGNDGNDKLAGEGGNDYLLGGAGKDDLFGQGGRDTLSGAGGNDRLFGGNDADRCLGGAGNDAAAQSDEDEFDSIETFLEA